MKNKKVATIIQTRNEVERKYEYSVKGFDVTESVEHLLYAFKEQYDKQKINFGSIKGYLEAQKEYEQQIRSLEEQLKNAIVPKFKIGQEVFMIIDKVEKAKIEKVIATVSKLDEESFTFYSITDSDGYALRLPEEQIFATREEAEKRLAELEGK